MSYRRVVWPDYVVLDLEEIQTSVDANAPGMGKAVVRRIIEATKQVREFPLSGRKVIQFEPSTVRQIFVEDYRIVYEIVDEYTVEIWMVLHTRRRFPPKKILDRKTFP